MLNHRIAIYPGTFDPMTRGHEDLVAPRRRSSSAWCSPLPSPAKRPHFWRNGWPWRRRSWLTSPIWKSPASIRCSWNFVHERGAKVIVRGLRAVSDFEYEFQMAGMNRSLSGSRNGVPDSGEQYMFISATMVREISRLGGDVSKFVQPCVEQRLRASSTIQFNERGKTAMA